MLGGRSAEDSQLANTLDVPRPFSSGWMSSDDALRLNLLLADDGGETEFV